LLTLQDLAPLEAHTRVVFENSPYDDSLLDDAGTGPGGPIPAKPGDPTPIRHVIYIVKGGLTYDELFGARKPGNGDPALVRYPESALPNHHRLAREFVLLDNFYRLGDGYGDGLQWSFAAIASDFVQKMWPAGAAGRLPWTALDGAEPAANPPAGYLWQNAALAGIPVRNFGCLAQEPALKPYTAPEPPARSAEGADTLLAAAFLQELAAYDQPAAAPPRLITICLHGPSLADQDRALGQIVEGVSKHRIWPASAIFIIEAGGPPARDHVSPYRAPAFVVSPYSRRGIIDSTFYNTASVLRTMELLLGLRPMTHYDAAARPLAACFRPDPDPTPYTAFGVTR
jgi:hypothetical protein